MPQCDRLSLWEASSTGGDLSARFLAGHSATVALGDLARGSILAGRLEEFRGRSVLVAPRAQLTAALALLELDGIARRLILCPPDLPLQDLPYVMAAAEVDAAVSDHFALELATSAIEPHVVCSPMAAVDSCDRTPTHQTEWVLLTSGTTGRPKMVVHTLQSLAGAIDSAVPASPVVWSTFYDIRRYGGVQIFLRAMLGGATLVISSPDETTAEFLARAGEHNVTHISGTPSHWRLALMSPSANRIAPQYVRLSGEIADQAILDSLRACYPGAVVAHAFATTEAGVAFDVSDGLAGLPASIMEHRSGVEMKVEEGSLRIRSDRNAVRYLGPDCPPLADADGFIDTGDLLELQGGRYHFAGRRDGMINVGGLKVHPEEVEAVINRHPKVRMSWVRTRKNPITGALVVADVVVRAPDSADGAAGNLEGEILDLCREALPRHKVPAAIRFVPAVALTATGKMVRRHA